MSETLVESSGTPSVNDGDAQESSNNVAANGHAADSQSTKKKSATPESNSETVDTGKNPKKVVKEKHADESKSPIKRKAKDDDGDHDKEASPAKKKAKKEGKEVPEIKEEAEDRSHSEKKSGNSEVKSGDDQEDEDEDDAEQEVKPGLLEMPIVLEEGVKREKKKVQRLELTPSADKSDASKKIEIADGAGVRLGEIPRVEFHLQKTHADELKPLHRLLFDKTVAAIQVKKNIRRFSGFPFSETSHELLKKKEKLERYTNPMLKSICEVLDIERGGKKDDIIERILHFLMKPESSGKALPAGKKRRSSVDKTNKTGTKKRKSGASKSKKKQSKKSEDSDGEAENNYEKDEQKSSSENESSAESESEGDSEKKKTQTKKATPVKKSKKGENKTPKSSAKKPAKKQSETPKKKATPKKSKKLQDSSDDSGDDDDEPLAKKSGPPTDSVLRDLIKKILKTANLEEVTMKTVCKQVYDKYPEYDLTSRKDFIKTTVKQILK